MLLDTSILTQVFLSGMTTGAIYALIAVGYVVIHNSTGVINLAQGEFAVLGALIMATLLTKSSMGLLASSVLAVLLVALIAMVVERVVIDPARDTGPVTKILLTIGVSIILRGMALLYWGTDPQGGKSFVRGALQLGGLELDFQSLWIIGSTALALAVFSYFLDRTKTGKAVRACFMNPFAARIMGINPRYMSLISFGLGGALGAFGGVIISPMVMVKYDTGLFLGLKGFVAAVFGGVSSVHGAVIGGVILGLTESFAAVLLPSGYRDAITFLVLIIVLTVSPGGIIGSTEVKRV